MVFLSLNIRILIYSYIISFLHLVVKSLNKNSLRVTKNLEKKTSDQS
jgi:hypothetical protein